MSSSSTSIIWIGMEVHKDTVMVAVFMDQRSEPEVVQQLPNDPRKLRRFFERWASRGEIRSCYEASGAGYVPVREAACMKPTDHEDPRHDRRDAQLHYAVALWAQPAMLE